MSNKFFILIFLIFPLGLLAQSRDTTTYFPGFDDSPRGNKGVRIAFYNCENLFDTEHDSLKRDFDFTPDGSYHWTTYKYWTKQKHLAKAISAIGGWEAPAIVGLAEIENRHVLINLVYNTGLKAHHYKIIHHESPDRRGIDIAMIYRSDKVEIIEEKALPVRFPFDTATRTRDILYVKVRVLYGDTLILLFNHWPSRWGGQFQTEPKRMFVARKIKHITDSIIRADPCAKLIVMGDLNDSPSNKSLVVGLEVKSPEAYTKQNLVDLMIPYEKKGLGTHYYAGGIGEPWSVLDHIIVSKSLLWDCSGIYVKDRKAYIFRAPFLLEKNAKNQIIPNRTNHGMKYHGGYSDHLPVYVDVYVKK